jgi:hypothetical protein
MKIQGYSRKDADRPNFQFGEEMLEVTLEATPAELREMAAFLNEAANHMEDLGERYSHQHLADLKPGFRSSPHFVVFNSDLTNT